jgi:hypothetical protein
VHRAKASVVTPEPERQGMDVEVEHDRDGHRFHALIDGHRAVVDYRLADSSSSVSISCSRSDLFAPFSIISGSPKCPTCS